MSSRALRKAQREREEQERLRTLEQQAHGESDEDEMPSQSAAKSAFALLEEEKDDVDDIDDEDDSGVPVNDEATTSAQKPALPEGMLTAKSTMKRKKKKKKKPKVAEENASAVPDTGDQGLDEIDRALKELSTNGNTSLPGTTTAGVDASTDDVCKLLAVDSNHLHSQNEMRRLFGRAALESQEEDQPPQPANIGGNRRQQRRVQQVGLAEALRGHGAGGGRATGLAATALRRNVFVQGKEEWPQATGGGLGMEVEEKRADGTILYRFVHNRIYQDVQAQFQIAVESMDPQRLVVLLQHNPYHISTLLQVSEIAKQERDHATSGDLLSRALFSFGRAIHSTFAKTLAEGKARLDFRQPENREFWLAAWRHMQNLSMRALWRTVYEWAKLLLSLAPEHDPYAMWVVLDQYALRARHDLDYLNISRNLAFKGTLQDMPNVQLSQGLAEYRAGNRNKGQQALFKAVGRYPWVVARLMQELSLDPPPAIWGKEPRTEKEKLDAELYAMRAKDVWNTPENTALLLEIASALPPDTPSASVNDSDVPENVARHVLLSDTPALIALIPKRYSAALVSASDPLPPSDSYPSYLPADLIRGAAHRTPAQEGQRGDVLDNLRELHGLYGFFSNLFPWFNRDGTERPDAAADLNEEEINRRITESGVDEEIIAQRTRRMIELQNRLRGGFGVDGFDYEPGDEVEAPDTADGGIEEETATRQPRVEDAEDAGD